MYVPVGLFSFRFELPIPPLVPGCCHCVNNSPTRFFVLSPFYTTILPSPGFFYRGCQIIPGSLIDLPDLSCDSTLLQVKRRFCDLVRCIGIFKLVIPLLCWSLPWFLLVRSLRRTTPPIPRISRLDGLFVFLRQVFLFGYYPHTKQPYIKDQN